MSSQKITIKEEYFKAKNSLFLGNISMFPSEYVRLTSYHYKELALINIFPKHQYYCNGLVNLYWPHRPSLKTIDDVLNNLFLDLNIDTYIKDYCEISFSILDSFKNKPMYYQNLITERSILLYSVGDIVSDLSYNFPEEVRKQVGYYAIIGSRAST